MKHKSTYMRTALNIALDSHCERLKVGCVVVKNNNIIGHGCNGTLPNRDNCCEINNVTKAEVVHAEACAIAKMSSLGINTTNSSLFVTHLPCPVCATLICTARIKEVFFLYEYRDTSSLDIFKSSSVPVYKMIEQEGKFVVKESKIKIQ